MKKVLFCLTLLLLCLDCAWAAELPDSVKDAVPPEAADILPEMDTSASHETLWQGLGDLWHSACAYVRTALETQASGAALLLGVVLLCSLAESCLAAADSPCVPRYVSVAGALAITLVAAGDFHRMMGLGVETMSSWRCSPRHCCPPCPPPWPPAAAISPPVPGRWPRCSSPICSSALSVRYCCRCCTPALLLPPRTPWFPAIVCKRSVRAFASASPGH